jgi:hypothetical protein
MPKLPKIRTTGLSQLNIPYFLTMMLLGGWDNAITA